MVRIGWIVAALVAVALPLAVPNPYYLQVVATAYITAISVYGLNVILGYTGLLNLGHAAFFGIGAYTLALLEKDRGTPFWLALPAAVVTSVAAGFLTGLISLRTRGHYFAIFTAALGVMIVTVFTNWQDVFGGNIGIADIAGPPAIGPISFRDPVPDYYVAFGGLVIAAGVSALARRSLFGRTLVAIALNENLARATGVNVTRAKLTAFMLSTALAGFAGALFAAHIHYLGPNSSGLDVTFDQLLFLVVGGLGTIAGPLIGTLGLMILSELLQGLQQYRFLLYGPLLVLLVIFAPRGIAGVLDRLRGTLRARGARVAPGPVTP